MNPTKIGIKHAEKARKLLKKKQALPLCGNKDIAFNQIEIINRQKKKIETRTINLRNIKNLDNSLKRKVKQDIKKITSKRKNFCNYIL